MLTTSHIHRIAIACAVGCALIGPAGATAEPRQDLRSPDAREAARTSSLAGTTSPKQDLRSPDARDAAELRTLPGPPTWPVNPQPITTEPVAEPAGAGGGVDWAPIGLGVAGALLGIGGLGALAVRRRSQRLRVAA